MNIERENMQKKSLRKENNSQFTCHISNFEEKHQYTFHLDSSNQKNSPCIESEIYLQKIESLGRDEESLLSEKAQEQKRKEFEEQGSQEIDQNQELFEFTNVKSSLSSIKPTIKRTISGIEIQQDAELLINGKWKKTKFMMAKDQIYFIQLGIKFVEMLKLKILPDNSDIRQKKRILKIQTIKQAYFCRFSLRKFRGFSFAYYVFLKLVYGKINQLNFPFCEKSLESKSLKQEFFSGIILKRSQHLLEWKQRFVSIKPEGLFSYRNLEEPHSFFINSEKIKYLWTRFQHVEGFLVIKVKHGITKTQFGIPAQDILKSSKNWLYQFCTMIR